MNTEELNFAYKVRHALNENLDHLPASTSDRLAAARAVALSRKRANAPARLMVKQGELVTNAGAGRFGKLPMSWLARIGAALPVLVLAAGIWGIYQYELEQHINETAEFDVAVLSDELPISAYLDHGFNTYLTDRGE